MTTFNRIEDLRDLSYRKVYGVIAIDDRSGWKFGCSLCLGEFPAFDLFEKHFASHSIKVLNDKIADTSNSNQADSSNDLSHANNADRKSDEIVGNNEAVNSDGNKIPKEVPIKNEGRSMPKNIPRINDGARTSNVGNSDAAIPLGAMANEEPSTPTESNSTMNHSQGESSIKCDFCIKTFANAQSLKRHMGTSHETEFQCRCSICGNGFHNDDDLNDHMRNHRTKAYNCDFFTCSAVLRSKYEKENHVKECHPNATFMCKRCKHEYKTERALQIHINMSHPRLAKSGESLMFAIENGH